MSQICRGEPKSLTHLLVTFLRGLHAVKQGIKNSFLVPLTEKEMMCLAAVSKKYLNIWV